MRFSRVTPGGENDNAAQELPGLTQSLQGDDGAGTNSLERVLASLYYAECMTKGGWVIFAIIFWAFVILVNLFETFALAVLVPFLVAFALAALALPYWALFHPGEDDGWLFLGPFLAVFIWGLSALVLASLAFGSWRDAPFVSGVLTGVWLSAVPAAIYWGGKRLERSKSRDRKET